MNPCPACRREVQDDLKECPHCGVVFAKWAVRTSRSATVFSPSSGEKRPEGGMKGRSFFSTCLLALSHPRRLFDEIKTGGSLKQATRFAVKIIGLMAVMSVSAGLAMQLIEIPARAKVNAALLRTNLVNPATGFPLAFIMMLLLAFLFAGLFHISVKLFGAKGSYRESFQVFIYGALLPLTVAALASGVLDLFISMGVMEPVGDGVIYDFSRHPGLNKISSWGSFAIAMGGLVWILYNMTHGGSILHGISKTKVVSSFVPYGVLVFLIFGVLVVAPHQLAHRAERARNALLYAARNGDTVTVQALLPRART